MARQTRSRSESRCWTRLCTAALLAFGFASSAEAASVTVEFIDVGCGVIQSRPDSEMESPSTVNGFPVLEFRDADDTGLPDWAPTGLVQGSATQAWLRDSGAEINTTTTVSGKAVFVHLQGDYNDGRADVEIDSVLKARLDMYHLSGTNNVRLVCDGLSNTTHAIRVNDLGVSSAGGGGDDVAAWGAGIVDQPAVEFLDADCVVSQGHSDSEMESPTTVDGRDVLEFRDSDLGGSPDWSATGSVDGSSSQAWLRGAGAEIDTTTTVSGKAVFVHLQGDNNDGRTEIEIDSVLKARLDMYHASGTNNVRLVCNGLADSTHTIRVNDIGDTNIGPSGSDDIASWGGGVLDTPPHSPPSSLPGAGAVPSLSLWGLAVLAAALLMGAATFRVRSRSARQPGTNG